MGDRPPRLLGIDMEAQNRGTDGHESKETRRRHERTMSTTTAISITVIETSSGSNNDNPGPGPTTLPITNG